MDQQPAPPVSADPPVQPPRPKATKLLYKGDEKTLFQVGLIGQVFTMASLGIYYPWAATGVRKYIAGKTLLNRKQPLEYTGTPQGLLKAAGPWAGGFAAASGVLYWSMISQSFLVFFLLLPLLYALAHAAFFAGLKYRLTHTGLKGTTFSLDASLRDYMILRLKRAAINLVSFGYAIPASDLQRWAFIANGLKLGKAKISYTGEPKNLRLTHLISFGIPFLFFIVIGMMAAPLFSGDPARNPEQVASAKAFLEIFFYIGLAGTFAGRAWYRAALKAEQWRALRLGKIRFKYELRGVQLLRHEALNAAILACTLGFGLPYVLHRNLKLKTRTLVIGGDIEQAIA